MRLFGAVFDDPEGFGTASRTRSFMIMGTTASTPSDPATGGARVLSVVFGACVAERVSRESVLLLVRVVDIEGLVGDEQERAVPVGRGAMLHDAAFREPDEAAGSEGALVRSEAAFEYLDAVGAGVGVPGIRPARR
jgi:hypothetical protein